MGSNTNRKNMSKIKLTSEYPFKIRQINDNTNF